jgi:hypothetical protein
MVETVDTCNSLNYAGPWPILQTASRTPTWRIARPAQNIHVGGKILMNPLLTVRGALSVGFVLALLVTLLIAPTSFHELGLARWLHILSGIMWIGLLYYFNVVQIPGLADAAADKGGPGGAGISKYIAPRALLWFRWAALATWLTGYWYLHRSGNANAFLLGAGTEPFKVISKRIK